jgi:hypothetical protein
MMMVSANKAKVNVQSLHDMDYVGIDTCSARSVSSEISDFLFLDRSLEASMSVSLNGVGEGGPRVLARGSMLVSTLDEEGRQTFMLDPAGVLIESSASQARLRIFGEQRMKRFGYYVVQDWASNKDALHYKGSVRIPLETKRGILMVRTTPWNLDLEQTRVIDKLVSDVVAKELDEYCFQMNVEDELVAKSNLPIMVMNVAKLSRIERERIDHWRHAHRSSKGERYEEKCHTCEASKHKAIYKQNKQYHGTSVSTNIPYWRMYSDAYGGQRSMGVESYEGGIGGFVFVCPVSGKIKAKSTLRLSNTLLLCIKSFKKLKVRDMFAVKYIAIQVQ